MKKRFPADFREKENGNGPKRRHGQEEILRKLEEANMGIPAADLLRSYRFRGEFATRSTQWLSADYKDLADELGKAFKASCPGMCDILNASSQN